MRASLTTALLVLGFPAGSAVAQASGIPRVELSAEEQGGEVELRISPGLSTVLVFDSAFRPDALELEGRERFTLVDAGVSTLRLEPSERVSPGERLRLTVRFQDGEAPRSARFTLVVHAAQAEPLVQVYRKKRPLESYRQEIEQTRASLHQCQQEVQRLQSEQGSPGGLRALLAFDIMEEHGVTRHNLTKTVPTQAQVMKAIGYRADTRVAVDVWLKDPAPGAPWKVVGAELRGEAGRRLRMLPVWQQGSNPQEEAPWSRIIVEAEATPQETSGTFTLKLWEAPGQRTLTLQGITFQ